MAHLTPAERRAFPHADSIPADVLKGLSRSELCDRLVFSAERTRIAKRAATPGQQREIIQSLLAMMAAPPRASTERAVQQRISKAMAAPDAHQGTALRRSARQLLADQPPAPRNRDAELIVKGAAGEDGLMLCCDEAGTVIGVCPAGSLVPVMLPSQVAKARAAAAPAGHVEAYDEHGAFVGYVKPGDIADHAGAQARNSGPVANTQAPGMGAIPGRAANQTMSTPSGRPVIKAAADPHMASLLAHGRQIAANYGRG